MTKTTVELALSAGLPFEVFDDEYCDAVDLPRGTICRLSSVGIEDIEKLVELVRADERARLLAVAGEPVAWLCKTHERTEVVINSWETFGQVFTLHTADQVASAVLRSHPSEERIMEVARKHWKLPGTDVIDFVRELLG